MFGTGDREQRGPIGDGRVVESPEQRRGTGSNCRRLVRRREMAALR